MANSTKNGLKEYKNVFLRRSTAADRTAVDRTAYHTTSVDEIDSGDIAMLLNKKAKKSIERQIDLGVGFDVCNIIGGWESTITRFTPNKREAWKCQHYLTFVLHVDSVYIPTEKLKADSNTCFLFVFERTPKGKYRMRVVVAECCLPDKPAIVLDKLVDHGRTLSAELSSRHWLLGQF